MAVLSFPASASARTFVTMNASTYRAYLSYLAANHPDLRHSEQDGGRVFAMMNIEEATSDLRGAATEKGFIMRGFHYTYRAAHDGDGRKSIQGGFMVAKSFSSRSEGRSSFFAAMDSSEQVIDELIERMVSDSRAGHPLFLHSLDSDQTFIVRPRPAVGDNYAGWFCTFDFYNHFRVCLTDQAAPGWLDGGQTPFVL